MAWRIGVPRRGGGYRYVQARNKPRRARNYGKQKVKPLKGFTKTQTIALKKAIGRKEETKYVSYDLWSNIGLDGAIHTIGLPGEAKDTMPLVPKINQGTQENQRVGRKVMPTRTCIDVNVNFNMTGDTPPGQNTQQIFVYLYILRSKSNHSYGKMYTDGSDWNHWCDNGDGTSTFFGGLDGGGNFISNVRTFMKPVETSEVTQLKRIRVKLTKNQGIVNGSGVANTVPNLASTSYSGRIYFKLPQLQYDDSDALNAGLPTNNNTFVSVGAALADGTDGLASNQAAVYTISARYHCWYKDA